ncbi:transcription initiation factor IID, 18kD subunit-domain-containing protein [Parachaetomium inaequale]|uniref:Transcription initiation factor IID, 18kD subunit-domain-containing protein n=1 Tax=Parachaetomium inaequale TaxID=2588326 RepID=A0AAN6SRH5_9PEZI|nr:transcription initiation factor IID, 18kD subunit-domain-containing protein [Parachaetomium inaequale]
MKTLFSLVVHLSLLQTCLGLCYYPNGDLAKDDHPCDPDAEHSPCCAAPTVGKACLANKLCVSPENIYARGSCTDPTWMSPECPNYCTRQPGQGWDMVSCSNVTKTDTSWCCFGETNCCNSGRGRVDILPNANTWALWDSTKTQWTVVSPLSTAQATSTTSSTPSASTSSSPTSTTGTNSGASQQSSQTGEATSPASATGTAGTAGTAGGQSSEATSSTGLSTGAQAGIGVGAAIGALLIATVAYLWWKLNKANKTAAESQWMAAAAYPPPAPASSYYPQDPAPKYELQGERATHELQGQHHIVQGDARSSELGSHASYAAESPLAGVVKVSMGAPRYRDEILKMMFVAEEMGEPSVSTTTVVENIVRDQTVHLLVVAAELAARRGQARFTTDDIIFQVRHDAERLARLQNHMHWKQIRKKAKVKDDEAADDLDLDEVDDLIEDDEGRDDAETTGPADSDSDPSTPQPKHAGTVKAGGPEVSIPPLPWSIISMFPHTADIPSIAALENDEAAEDGEQGPPLDQGSTTSRWLLARLQKNDKRTNRMTADEYSTFSECRSASFTFRKKKTFRGWCGLGVIADHRRKDNVLEILGFLTSEWVRTLTERALEVKEQELRALKYAAAKARAGVKRKFDEPGPFTMRDGEDGTLEKDADEVPMLKSPIQPQHVRRAFEILQTPPKNYTAMMNGTRLRQRKRLRIF